MVYIEGLQVIISKLSIVFLSPKIDFYLSKQCRPGSSGSSLFARVHMDLEKSLNLTLVLENFWSLKNGPFVMELSWNFAHMSLKMLIGPGYNSLNLWDMQKMS